MTTLSASFSVVDTHTAGHPTRVILSGVPKLEGRSVLEKREDFRARFDTLRALLLHEPRGHAAMVGLVPVHSEVADYGAFFVSSYVYLDMCGHGTIGFAKTLAATGQISPATGDSFTLETPAGTVEVRLTWSGAGELAAVRLRNVACRFGPAALQVDVEGLGHVTAEIVYGGMWYALVDAAPLGLDLCADNASTLMRVGSSIKTAIAKEVANLPEMAGAVAPSVLFFRETGPAEATHFLVLDINKFDRSPCGTGTSARLAALARQGRLNPDGRYVARNVLGHTFVAELVDETSEGLVADVSGNAFLTAFSTIVVERDDRLGGFLPR